MSLVALRRTFLVGLGYVLICIPGILLSERGAIPLHQSFFHVSQFVACLVTVVAAAAYVVTRRRAGVLEEAGDRPRREEPKWALPVALLTLMGIAAWLIFAATTVVFLASTMETLDG